MIKLYNTLTKSKSVFTPISDHLVKMYVCGPTVYDYPHIGNARSVVVYDVLYRILKNIYKDVLYVRNITDIDDKIINIASKKGLSTEKVSNKYHKIFLHNCIFLNCLPPNIEPKATENIDYIINFISDLEKKGFAYKTEKGNVYFKVDKFKQYGFLSGKKISDLTSNIRIQNKEDKININDFVLWKKESNNYWDSPWGKGRPGWHIECSAMSNRFLGENFDIHGGGIDLQFPHHENEIAQSKCANKNSFFVKYWVHNGFVTVNGLKMSKSIGNTVTVEKLYNMGHSGCVVRYALLSSHYRKPLDWSDKLLLESRKSLTKIFSIFDINKYRDNTTYTLDNDIYDDCILSLYDDMDVSLTIRKIFKYINNVKYYKHKENQIYNTLFTLNKVLFLLGIEYIEHSLYEDKNFVYEIEELISKRNYYRSKNDFIESDILSQQLNNKNIQAMDNINNKSTWYIKTII